MHERFPICVSAGRMTDDDDDVVIFLCAPSMQWRQRWLFIMLCLTFDDWIRWRDFMLILTESTSDAVLYRIIRNSTCTLGYGWLFQRSSMAEKKISSMLKMELDVWKEVNSEMWQLDLVFNGTFFIIWFLLQFAFEGDSNNFVYFRGAFFFSSQFTSFFFSSQRKTFFYTNAQNRRKIYLSNIPI